MISWVDVKKTTEAYMGTYTVRAAQQGPPSTVPEPTLLLDNDGPPESDKAVIFFRDCNGWDPVS